MKLGINLFNLQEYNSDKVWFIVIAFQVLRSKKVFKNQAESTVKRFLVSKDLNLTSAELINTCHKR